MTLHLLYGQGIEVPVITHKHSTPKESARARQQRTASLALPFWDDFSQSRNFPDTTRWENSANVTISPTDGINNMSLNVAVFNGVDATGAPHSNLPLENGDTDILTSCPIDLSGHLPTDGIYLSFFYEKKGNGELPNDNDGIRVEYMNENSEWVTNIWSITGKEVMEVDRFYQVLLPIDDLQYFSDAFRFRFVATGRQSGLFDTWLIDYVYLNAGRDIDDTTYPDRTFTKPISSPFKGYYSVPIEHFLTDPLSLIDSVGSQFVKLGNNSNTVYVYEMDFALKYVDDNGDTIKVDPIQHLVTRADNIEDFNELIPLFLHRDFLNDSLPEINITPSSQYAELSYTLIGDFVDDVSFAGSIDLSINDTVRNTFVLDNYYAYDDGTAERGGGINIAGNQLAYAFELQQSSSDELSAIDIYFPKSIDEVQFGKQIRLKIWSSQGELPGEELYSKDIFIQKVDTLNQFYRYPLTDKVAVSNTFYVGWEQLIADRIYVGLDKNTNSSERIYFNTTGAWERNVNDIIGSLMIRPVFGELEDNGTIASIATQDFDRSITVYPNPTSGTFAIDGDYDHLELLTLSGKTISADIRKSPGKANITLPPLLPMGMYLIRLRKGNLIITKKIIRN